MVAAPHAPILLAYADQSSCQSKVEDKHAPHH